MRSSTSLISWKRSTNLLTGSWSCATDGWSEPERPRKSIKRSLTTLMVGRELAEIDADLASERDAAALKAKAAPVTMRVRDLQGLEAAERRHFRTARWRDFGSWRSDGGSVGLKSPRRFSASIRRQAAIEIRGKIVRAPNAREGAGKGTSLGLGRSPRRSDLSRTQRSRESDFDDPQIADAVRGDISPGRHAESRSSADSANMEFGIPDWKRRWSRFPAATSRNA